MSEPPTLYLAAAINRHYLLPLRVFLYSIRANLREGRRPVLFLIHTDLTADDIALLSPFCEVRSIVPDAEQLARIPRSRRYRGVLASPAVLPDLLPPELERVLFLDADMFAMDDLTPLFQADMGDAPLGAVQDLAIPYTSLSRGLPIGAAPSGTPYFNCGVLLIQPAIWKAHKVSERCGKYLAQHGDQARYFHQEALNAVLLNDWHRLDTRWNVIASVAIHDARHAPSHPALIHFAGRIKPWLSPMRGAIGKAYGEVLNELHARPESRIRDRALSLYDRYLRPATYPLESYLWRKGML